MVAALLVLLDTEAFLATKEILTALTALIRAMFAFTGWVTVVHEIIPAHSSVLWDLLLIIGAYCIVVIPVNTFVVVENVIDIWTWSVTNQMARLITILTLITPVRLHAHRHSTILAIITTTSALVAALTWAWISWWLCRWLSRWLRRGCVLVALRWSLLWLVWFVWRFLHVTPTQGLLSQ